MSDAELEAEVMRLTKQAEEDANTFNQHHEDMLAQLAEAQKEVDKYYQLWMHMVDENTKTADKLRIAVRFLDRFREQSTDFAGEPWYEELWRDVDSFLAHEQSDNGPAAMQAEVIICKTPGMVNGDTKVEQQPDGSWLATAPIGDLFGSPVDGECRGMGETKEAALVALQADQDRLYESLWV